MLKLIQINLNHCWAAQQLLPQTAIDYGADLMLVSDQWRNPEDRERWLSSSDGKCAIVATALSAVSFGACGSGKGFVWVAVGQVVVFSCYYTPNCKVSEFDEFLGNLDASIRALGDCTVVVGGDFNAHSTEWGCPADDARGDLLANFCASLDLAVCNRGSTPTYTRYNARSIVDVTFVRADSDWEVIDWRVLSDVGSESDHCYVAYGLQASVSSRLPVVVVPERGRG